MWRAGKLGTDPFGVLTLALAFSVSAGYLTVADLGLQSGVSRFVADADGRGQRERIGEVVSSALAVLSVTAIVAVAILLTLSFVGTHIFNVGDAALQNDLRVLFMFFAAEALFGLPGLAFLGVLQGLQRFGWVKLVDLSRQILYTILALTVLLTGRGVIWFGAAMISGTIFAAIGYAVAAEAALPRDAHLPTTSSSRRATTTGDDSAGGCSSRESTA